MGGPLIGTPVISFRQDFNISGLTSTNVFESMRFTDVSESAGLNVLPVLGDSLNGEQFGAYIMALADFDAVIPLDEVIDTMDEVGKSLPSELRCTALGGLSKTMTW